MDDDWSHEPNFIHRTIMLQLGLFILFTLEADK